jgi:hypothetical protein
VDPSAGPLVSQAKKCDGEIETIIQCTHEVDMDGRPPPLHVNTYLHPTRVVDSLWMLIF